MNTQINSWQIVWNKLVLKKNDPLLVLFGFVVLVTAKWNCGNDITRQLFWAAVFCCSGQVFKKNGCPEHVSRSVITTILFGCNEHYKTKKKTENESFRLIILIRDFFLARSLKIIYSWGTTLFKLHFSFIFNPPIGVWIGSGNWEVGQIVPTNIWYRIRFKRFVFNQSLLTIWIQINN